MAMSTVPTPRLQTIIEKIVAVESNLAAIGIVRLSIFGSYARGEERPHSDLDVLAAVDGSRGGYFVLAHAQEILEEALGLVIDIHFDTQPPDGDRARTDAIAVIGKLPWEGVQ
jgi:predicted nucleotidyltransferase